jgi:hypothetical protein
MVGSQLVLMFVDSREDLTRAVSFSRAATSTALPTGPIRGSAGRRESSAAGGGLARTSGRAVTCSRCR